MPTLQLLPGRPAAYRQRAMDRVTPPSRGNREFFLIGQEIAGQGCNGYVDSIWIIRCEYPAMRMRGLAGSLYLVAEREGLSS